MTVMRPSGLRPCQHVRTKQDHVTGLNGLLTELAEHERGAVAGDDHLHTVIGQRLHGTVHGLSARREWAKVVHGMA